MKKFLNTQNFLICLVGLPASGKSTFANMLKIALEKRFNNLDIKIIDPDKIRQVINPDKFNHEKEHIVRNENLRRIKEELEKGNFVISDDLNYYSSMRHDLREIAINLNSYFFIIHISTPIETCIKWNEDRGEPIPNPLISKVNDKFDKFGKYNWDFPDATYNLSQISNLNQVIEDLLDNFIKKIQVLGVESRKKKIKNQSSNLDNENLDKITRIFVGELLHKTHYLHLKDRIIKLRKSYVKQNKNKALIETDILNSFRKYLEKILNIKIS
jgi:tRNA uridine 5-carbamoylmethylation protein Kti12